jgi:hypothetical protein
MAEETPQEEPLDPQIVALARAIRQVETGNKAVKGASGEMKSRYQFMPATWKTLAKKHLGNADTTRSEEIENEVVYKELLFLADEKGYDVGQIASVWNSGKPDFTGKGTNKKGVKFDTGAYRDKVYKAYVKFRDAEEE